jgi:hypothetical protein
VGSLHPEEGFDILDVFCIWVEEDERKIALPEAEETGSERGRRRGDGSRLLALELDFSVERVI